MTVLYTILDNTILLLVPPVSFIVFGGLLFFEYMVTTSIFEDLHPVPIEPFVSFDKKNIATNDANEILVPSRDSSNAPRQTPVNVVP